MATVLITGANRGIGREVAQVLLSEGWHVISAVRDPRSAPPGTQAEAVDLGDAASIEAMARRVLERRQPLDALINNAGVYQRPARETWDVNVRGPLLLTRALSPLLAPGARVIMVTSGLGKWSAQSRALVQRLSDPHLSPDDLARLAQEAPGGYPASKAAVIALARVFARELASRGILVNAISPGWARTDMGGPGAPLSVQQGAASVLWGVRLGAGGPSGGAFEHGKPLE